MRSRRRLLPAMFVLLLPQGLARADLVVGFGGNTQPEIATPVGVTQGFLNFAVYDTAGGAAGDHYGTGKAGIDAALAAAGFSTTSSFLYLFQAVNVGSDIASASVNADGAAVTGDGFLSGLTYAQVTGSHPFLGSAAASPGNISPAVTDGTQSGATATAFGAAVSPTLLTLNAGSLVATFSPALFGPDARSSLWGYTSDLSPAYVLGSIQDSGLAANGTVPGGVNAIPEPSSMVLLILGGLGLLAGPLLRGWSAGG